MVFLTLLLFPLLSAASLHSRHDAHDHSHVAARRLPSSWYQRDDHPVHLLFKRAPSTDGVTYAPVGSPAWSAAYPASTPDAKAMPVQWINALGNAVASKAIPDIPASSNVPMQNPVYPAGFDPNGAIVCSATYKCKNPADIWDGPDGTIGLSFDDGPQPVSDTLLGFLKQNNQIATHFMIGVNILQNPVQFQSTYDSGEDIAVHTWTHPYMTTLSNEDIVAQLGWTMALIHNSTGGRVPKFWRPPFGDSDNRVRAIAKEVFGLTTVIWNQDTRDWSIGIQDGTTAEIVNASMTQWLTGAKSPGLIILEHERSDASVKSFMDAYPLMKSNNWQIKSLVQLVAGGGSAYQNSNGPVGKVAIAGILAQNANTQPAPIPSTTSSSTSNPTITVTSVKAAGAPASTPNNSDNSDTAVDPSTSNTGSAPSSWRIAPSALFYLAVSVSFVLWT